MRRNIVILSFVVLCSVIYAAGAGNVVWSPDGRTLAVTSWNDEGLWLIDAQTSAVGQIEIEGIRGRNIEFGDGLIFAKTITDAGQTPVAVGIFDDEIIPLSMPQKSAGAPFAVGENIGCAIGDEIIIYDANFDIAHAFYASELPHEFVSDGDRIVWADANGVVHSIDVVSGTTSDYPGPTSLWRPRFIDGDILAKGSDGQIWQLCNGLWKVVCEGHSPLAYRGEILVTRIRSEAMVVIESDLYSITDDTETKIDGGGYIIGHAAISPDESRIAFVDLSCGDLCIADFDGARISDIRVLADADIFDIETPHRRPSEPMLNNYAPYLHQVYDTPDDYNGSWSCGPSSCMMAQGKYSILPHHDVTCSYPWSHTSHWGWYINNIYTFNGITYDTLGLAAGDVWVYGAHGFICREYGGAVWAYMRDWLNQHTLISTIDYSPTWSEYTSEIDGGYVVVASNTIRGLGHIILFKGYEADHSFYVNDPWGNANTDPYKDYYGADAILDWMGYDNGHVQPDVHGIISAHSGGGSEPDTIVDDLSSGFAKYGSSAFWWDDGIGWESHMCYTYSTNATDTTNDTCYTTWTPVLPDRRNYEVFTYVPNNHAVASAKYRVYHDLGVTESVVRQADYSNEWVSLGTYICEAGAGSWVYLGDGTGFSGEQIGFDAIKWSDRGALPSPDTLVGLFSDGFRWGGPIKWRRIVPGGIDGNFFWTGSITSTTDVNSGTWTPILPEGGEYDVYANITSTHATAENAIYHVHHAGGEATESIDQSSYGDEWVHLGRYTFTGGGSEYVYLGDYTGTSGREICFDAVVWRSVAMGVESGLPGEFSLRAYPNPFNSSVSIVVEQSESAKRPNASDSECFIIEIYDLAGHMVSMISTERGTRVVWDGKSFGGSDLPGGIYMAKIEFGELSKTIRLLYLK